MLPNDTHPQTMRASKTRQPEVVQNFVPPTILAATIHDHESRSQQRPLVDDKSPESPKRGGKRDDGI